jgi:hypothetical protein
VFGLCGWHSGIDQVGVERAAVIGNAHYGLNFWQILPGRGFVCLMIAAVLTARGSQLEVGLGLTLFPAAVVFVRKFAR